MSDDQFNLLLGYLQRIEARMDRLEAGQQTLRVDLMTRMDRLDNRLDVRLSLIERRLELRDQA